MYKQGSKVGAEEPDFTEAMRAAVDYRGDVTLELKGGEKIEGYIFNFRADKISMYPKHEPGKRHISLGEVASLHFTGIDKSSIRSWEDYERTQG
jgi:hypothetical protein